MKSASVVTPVWITVTAMVKKRARGLSAIAPAAKYQTTLLLISSDGEAVFSFPA